MPVSYPPNTIEDVEDIILTRLALNCAEIEGVKKAYETPPSVTVDLGSLPITYTLVGPMLYPVARDEDGSGMIVLSRQYTIRLLLYPFTTGVDSNVQGAQANVIARPYYARFRSYFVGRHTKLGTDGLFAAALPELSLTQGVEFKDSGLQPMLGPGGATYAAIDFDLTVSVMLDAGDV